MTPPLTNTARPDQPPGGRFSLPPDPLERELVAQALLARPRPYSKGLRHAGPGALLQWSAVEPLFPTFPIPDLFVDLPANVKEVNAWSATHRGRGRNIHQSCQRAHGATHRSPARSECEEGHLVRACPLAGLRSSRWLAPR